MRIRPIKKHSVVAAMIVKHPIPASVEISDKTDRLVLCYWSQAKNVNPLIASFNGNEESLRDFLRPERSMWSPSQLSCIAQARLSPSYPCIEPNNLCLANAFFPESHPLL